MYTVGCVVHCLIEKCCTFIYKKWLYVSYIFTNLKNERDTANMETRLHENDFSTVITVCCRTNNRGKVSPSPSKPQIFKSLVLGNLSILNQSPHFWNLNLLISVSQDSACIRFFFYSTVTQYLTFAFHKNPTICFEKPGPSEAHDNIPTA